MQNEAMWRRPQVDTASVHCSVSPAPVAFARCLPLPGGRWMIAAARNGKLYSWDVVNAKTPKRFSKVHGYTVTAKAGMLISDTVSSDNMVVLATCNRSDPFFHADAIDFWETPADAPGTLVHHLGTMRAPYCMMHSMRGDYLVIGYRSSTMLAVMNWRAMLVSGCPFFFQLLSSEWFSEVRTRCADSSTPTDRFLQPGSHTISAILSQTTLLSINSRGLHLFQLQPDNLASATSFRTVAPQQPPIWQHLFPRRFTPYGRSPITCHTPLHAGMEEFSVTVEYMFGLVRLDKVANSYKCQESLLASRYEYRSDLIAVGRHRSILTSYDYDKMVWTLRCYSHLQLTAGPQATRKIQGPSWTVDCSTFAQPTGWHHAVHFDEITNRLVGVFDMSYNFDENEPDQTLLYTLRFSV